GPSLWMRLVRARIRVTYDPMPDPDRARNIHAHRTYPAPAPLPGSFRERYDVRENRVRGEPVLTLLPKPAPSAWHIVYTHGGGYVNALGKTHWEIIRALLEATRASVTVPIYPLADRVIAAGGSAQLFEFKGAYHGFVGAMITPEAREVFSDVRKTLADRL
ncbi:MAG: hypothetical protein ACJ79W_07935, partial [Myxococcales bacterium]